MKSVILKEILKFDHNSYHKVRDSIVVEEPLDIYINSSTSPSLLAMRTPGEDICLSVGLLFSRELISSYKDIAEVKSLGANAIRFTLPAVKDFESINTIINSSCGLCNGKSWEDVASHSLYPVYNKQVSVKEDIILSATELLYADDDDFSLTGGNHKVALISGNGEIQMSFEDVGRHNAFDKVIGQCLINNSLPLSNAFAVLSGRCSYEMCLKAWQSGIPLIISKGAPTSKAVELADAAGITLVGFALKDRFNIYTHPYRIIE